VVGDADEEVRTVIRDHPEIIAEDVDADVVVAEEKEDANHGTIDHAEVGTEAGTAEEKVAADVEVVVKEEGEVKEEILMEIFLRYRNPPEVTKTP